MSKQANVPKFGDWDANDQVPFTVVFEKARAGKGPGTENKIFNPNDPSENPSAFARQSNDNAPPPFRRPPPSQPQHPEDLGGIRPVAAVSGGRPHMTGRPTTGNHFKRPSQGSNSDSDGSGFGEANNRSVEQAPSHPAPAFRGRHVGNQPPAPSSAVGPKGPADNIASSHHQAAAAPAARNRSRPSLTEDTPADRTGALPKFGAWDEMDPSAGDGYTVIFSQARNEKKVGGPTRVPALHQSEPPAAAAARTDYTHGNNQPLRHHTSWWPCCFHSRAAT